MKYPEFKIDTKHRRIRSNFSLDRNPLLKKISAMEPAAVQNTIPLTWKSAENHSVFDGLGNKWIDLTSGIFVTNTGHSNEAIKKGIIKQLNSNLLFSYNYPTKIKEKLLRKLLKLSPGYFNRVALLNTGSEAVDLTFKLMKLYAKKENKKYIVTFNGSYHGRGLSNDLISGNKEKAKEWSGLSDDGVVFMDFPYGDNDGFKPKKLPPGKQIAAFMLETYQGWGAWFYPDDFIKDLYDFARQNKALICFDEIQAGFFRLGKIYGYMTYGPEIKPDIICLGKGLTSSLPLSAVLSDKRILDINEQADMHGTNSSNPICCAAGLANLEFLSRNVGKFRKTIKVFETETKKLSKLGIVKRVNVRGMIAGIIFEKTETATAIVKDCVANGVLLVCTDRNSIKIAPPLTITIPALRESLEVLASSIRNISQ